MTRVMTLGDSTAVWEYMTAIKEVTHNSRAIPWLLFITPPLSFFGVHHLWLGRYRQFALYCLTFSLWGLGWLYDLFHLSEYIDEHCVSDIKPIKMPMSASVSVRTGPLEHNHRPSRHSVETRGEIKYEGEDETLMLSHPPIMSIDDRISSKVTDNGGHNIQRDTRTELPVIGRDIAQAQAQTFTLDSLPSTITTDSFTIKSAEHMLSPPATDSPLSFEAAAALDAARALDSVENRSISGEDRNGSRTAEHDELERHVQAAFKSAEETLEKQSAHANGNGQAVTVNVDSAAVCQLSENRNKTNDKLRAATIIAEVKAQSPAQRSQSSEVPESAAAATAASGNGGGKSKNKRKNKNRK